VNDLIVEGKQLLEALARNRFPIVAALWSYFPESMEWRLVIVTPTADRAPLAAYARVRRALDRTAPPLLTLSDIALVGPSSDDYQAFRSVGSSIGRFGKGFTESRVQYAVPEDTYVYQLP